MLLYRPLDNLSLLFNIHAGQVNNRPMQYRHIGDVFLQPELIHQ